MNKKSFHFYLLVIFFTTGCHEIYNKRHPKTSSEKDSIITNIPIHLKDTTLKTDPLSINTDSAIIPIIDTLPNMIRTGNITSDSVINFAKSLIGTPYRYGSVDPKAGFDCSGFFTYVFGHFKIKVPRASKEFEYSGIKIPLAQAKKGDLVLFTGTDSTERFIGHMGLILSNENGNIQFIHSSSGKAHGVTISPLDKYYMGRFMKVIRIFIRS